MNIFLWPFQEEMVNQFNAAHESDPSIKKVAIICGRKQKAPKILLNYCKWQHMDVTVIDYESTQTSRKYSSLGKNSFDIVVSYLALSTLTSSKQDDCLRFMSHIAPKALFMDYEVAERNMGLPASFLLQFGVHLYELPSTVSAAIANFKCPCCKKNAKRQIKPIKKPSVHCAFSNFMKQGGLEALLYKKILIENASTQGKLLERKHIGCGGLGTALVEWS